MRQGFTVLHNLLPELHMREVIEDPAKEGPPFWDFKLDPVAKAYISALRPSCVEVGPGPWTLDFHYWRVRVQLVQNMDTKWRIESISQEVIVDLDDSIENGYDLGCQVKGIETPDLSLGIINSGVLKSFRDTIC